MLRIERILRIAPRERKKHRATSPFSCCFPSNSCCARSFLVCGAMRTIRSIRSIRIPLRLSGRPVRLTCV